MDVSPPYKAGPALASPLQQWPSPWGQPVPTQGPHGGHCAPGAHPWAHTRIAAPVSQLEGPVPHGSQTQRPAEALPSPPALGGRRTHGLSHGLQSSWARGPMAADTCPDDTPFPVTSPLSSKVFQAFSHMNSIQSQGLPGARSRECPAGRECKLGISRSCCCEAENWDSDPKLKASGESAQKVNQRAISRVTAGLLR